MPIEFRRAARALISVSDKTGLIEFARGAGRARRELISTGGTRQGAARGGPGGAATSPSSPAFPR